LYSATTTDVEEVVETRQRRSGATTDWGINVLAQAGAGAGGKAGWILILLKNRKTGRTATYHGEYGGGEFGVSIEIAKTGLSQQFTNFKTKVPMSFADFDGARFNVASTSLALGLGYEWSRFRFLHFVGGQPVPDAIQLSGATAGGIGVTGLSEIIGVMFLQGRPPEWQEVVTRTPRLREYRSEGQEASVHRVFFSTGSSVISGDEKVALGVYLSMTVRKLQTPVSP
jgi:hypothetical protein